MVDENHVHYKMTTTFSCQRRWYFNTYLLTFKSVQILFNRDISIRTCSLRKPILSFWHLNLIHHTYVIKTIQKNLAPKCIILHGNTRNMFWLTTISLQKVDEENKDCPGLRYSSLVFLIKTPSSHEEARKAKIIQPWTFLHIVYLSQYIQRPSFLWMIPNLN